MLWSFTIDNQIRELFAIIFVRNFHIVVTWVLLLTLVFNSRAVELGLLLRDLLGNMFCCFVAGVAVSCIAATFMYVLLRSLIMARDRKSVSYDSIQQCPGFLC